MVNSAYGKMLSQQTLKGVAPGFSMLTWHPQGTYLAAGGDQGEPLIWKPVTRGQGFQQRGYSLRFDRLE